MKSAGNAQFDSNKQLYLAALFSVFCIYTCTILSVEVDNEAMRHEVAGTGYIRISSRRSVPVGNEGCVPN